MLQGQFGQYKNGKADDDSAEERIGPAFLYGCLRGMLRAGLGASAARFCSKPEASDQTTNQT
jgi:hypothetical protein